MTSQLLSDSSASHSDPDPLTSIEWKQLCEVMNGYIYSQALATACELDVFTWLSAHPGATQEQLAQGLGLAAHGARILMLACCATGLVLRDADGGYRNSEVAGEGMAYPYIQHEEALRWAGFSSVMTHRAAEVDHGALAAVK